MPRGGRRVGAGRKPGPRKAVVLRMDGGRRLSMPTPPVAASIPADLAALADPPAERDDLPALPFDDDDVKPQPGANEPPRREPAERRGVYTGSAIVCLSTLRTALAPHARAREMKLGGRFFSERISDE